MLINRDTGDTGPAITAQLRVNGNPFTLSGASVVGVIAGTVGSGPAATYQRWVLGATWNTASVASAASVTIPLNPSNMAANGTGWPCASPGRLLLEVRGVDANGVKYNWPEGPAIPFIVRSSL